MYSLCMILIPDPWLFELNDNASNPLKWMVSWKSQRQNLAQLVSYDESSAASTGSMQEGHVKDLISQSSIQSRW